MIKKTFFICLTALCTGFMYTAPANQATGKTKITKTAKVKRKRPDSQSIIFSSQTIDLSAIDLSDPETPKTFSVNVVFGKAVVIIDPAMKLKINANASFCSSVTLPDGTKISSSGDSNAVYEQNLEDEAGNAAKPEFFINANATLGSIVIVTGE